MYVVDLESFHISDSEFHIVDSMTAEKQYEWLADKVKSGYVGIDRIFKEVDFDEQKQQLWYF